MHGRVIEDRLWQRSSRRTPAENLGILFEERKDRRNHLASDMAHDLALALLTPHVLAALRNGLLTLRRCHGWTNMAAALRHIAAGVDRAFCLLVDPVPRLHTRL